VNRGTAGDTLQGVPGLKVSALTVGEVIRLQARGAVFAVGAFQFIPSTLSEAVQAAGVPLSRRFDAATQEALALHLLRVKRPEVSAYVRGVGGLEPAALALAKEWASIGTPTPAGDAVRRGESFYGSVGGNLATMPPDEAEALLMSARAGTLTDPTAPAQ
jgi:type VI secretion system secreted protein VgrG